MSHEFEWKKVRVLATAVTAVAALLVLALALRGQLPSIPIQSSLEIRDKTRHLVAAMRVDLRASAEAEKSAVLATTDQASQELADQATRASALVERDRRELEELLPKDGSPAAMERLAEFDACWKTFQEIDAVLLPMAARNTNLKASDLAYGQAAEAMRHVDEALGAIVESSGSSATGVEAVKLSFRAAVAAHEIQALEPPHIAESSDEKMDQIEARMNARNATVSDALGRLKALPGANAGPSFEAARTAYESFWRTNAEILRLSRENSNVRSLALSLGRKRVVTAQCADALDALQAIVDTSTFRATR